MRGRRAHAHDSRGLSEIVGTLMLVVIVVGAATVFSVFVANYEKQYDAQQALLHDEELEKIDILSIDPQLSTSVAGQYGNLSFIAESLDVNTMQVIQISINGVPLAFFTVTSLNTGKSENVCDVCQGALQTFNLTSQEQVRVFLNTSLFSNQTNGAAGSSPGGGFLTPYALTTSSYVLVSIYTSLGNDFTHVFVPPTAVITTSQSEIYSGGEYVPVLDLDGSNSVSPANATVAAWAWSVFPGLGSAESSVVANAPSSSDPTTFTGVGSSSSEPTTETGNASFSLPSGQEYESGQLSLQFSSATPAGITSGPVILSSFQSGTSLVLEYQFTGYNSSDGTTLEVVGATLGGITGTPSGDSPYSVGTSPSDATTVTDTASFTVPAGSDITTGAVVLTLDDTATIVAGPVVTDSSVSGGTVTLTFEFSVYDTSGSTYVDGVSMTYSYASTYLGEEQVIPQSEFVNTVYTISLTVLDTDQLFGEASLSYTG